MGVVVMLRERGVYCVYMGFLVEVIFLLLLFLGLILLVIFCRFFIEVFGDIDEN